MPEIYCKKTDCLNYDKLNETCRAFTVFINEDGFCTDYEKIDDFDNPDHERDIKEVI